MFALAGSNTVKPQAVSSEDMKERMGNLRVVPAG